MDRMIGAALDIAPPDARHAAALQRAAQERPAYELRSVLDGAEHVIHGGRQEGRTRLAERWLAETPEGGRRVLVTLTTDLAAHINDRLPRDAGGEAISYRQLLNRGADAGTEYGFDETVEILVRVFKLNEPPRLVTLSTAAPWQGSDPAPAVDDAPESEPMLRWFAHARLPEGPLRETSRLFAVVARQLVDTLPRTLERTVALRKLLESKDAAVRNALDATTD